MRFFNANADIGIYISRESNVIEVASRLLLTTKIKHRFKVKMIECIMDSDAIGIARKFWGLMATNDFKSVGSVLADEFVLDWPQSGERICGRDNYAAMNSQYPTTTGRWTFIINRVVGNDNEAVSDVTVSDGVQIARAISFFEIH